MVFLPQRPDCRELSPTSAQLAGSMGKACRDIGLGFFQVQMIVAMRLGNDERPEGETASSVTTKGTQGALVRKKEWTLKPQESGWIGASGTRSETWRSSSA